MTAKIRVQPGKCAQVITVEPRAVELLREVEDLRERIKVLERIATDGRSTAALANEIESLRERKD